MPSTIAYCLVQFGFCLFAFRRNDDAAMAGWCLVPINRMRSPFVNLKRESFAPASLCNAKHIMGALLFSGSSFTQYPLRFLNTRRARTLPSDGSYQCRFTWLSYDRLNLWCIRYHIFALGSFMRTNNKKRRTLFIELCSNLCDCFTIGCRRNERCRRERWETQRNLLGYWKGNKSARSRALAQRENDTAR